MWVRYLGWEDTLEAGMATHSSVRIPWTEELASYSPRGCKESDATEGTEHPLGSGINGHKVISIAEETA